MSLLRVRGRERRVFGDSLAQLMELRGGRTYATGEPVNDDTAMRLGAVFACVDLVGELVSTLPVDEYRRSTEGALVPMTPPPLITDPAGDGTGFEVWSRMVMTSLLLRGNAYGLILGLGSDGWPSQVEVLHPDRITLARPLTFGPTTFYLDNRPIERWPLGPLWHLPAYNVPGYPVGLSPIRYAAETIGVGLAAQKFGAQWFGDGAHPTGTLSSDQEINEDQATLLKQRFVKAYESNREPLVLGAGTKFEPIQVAPDESQFLETMQANVADVCRFFRVPPEMIGGESGNSMTYANMEQRGLALLTFTINGWLVRIERSLTRLRPRPRFVKFNADALLRVDLKTRYDAHGAAIRAGWKSRNEVRRNEDMAGIGPEGDEYLWPPYSTTAPSEEASPTGDANTEGDTPPTDEAKGAAVADVLRSSQRRNGTLTNTEK